MRQGATRAAANRPRKVKRTAPTRTKRTAPKKTQRTSPTKAKRSSSKKAKRTAQKKITRTSSRSAKPSSIAAMQAEISALQTALQEAQARENAIGEVMGVINSSPGDLAPVFDAMLDKALALCDAAFGVLWTYDGEAVRAVALRNVPDPYRVHMADQTFRLDRASLMGRAVRGQIVHIADNAAEEPYRNRVPIAVAAVELAGTRTFVHVPLSKDDIVLAVG